MIGVGVFVEWFFGFGVKRRLALIGALDNLIQFASIEPNTTAVWAVVYFYAVSIGHQQVNITVWALHSSFSRCGVRMIGNNRGAYCLKRGSVVAFFAGMEGCICVECLDRFLNLRADIFEREACFVEGVVAIFTEPHQFVDFSFPAVAFDD